MRADSMCYSSCLDRFYGDLVTLACLVCPYDCLTCNSGGNCLSCDGATDHRTINNQTSRCDPSVGYYESGVTVAALCPEGCATCINGQACDSCVSGFYLRADNLCYTTCLPRFFKNTTARTCEHCDYDCYTCASAGSCLTCNETLDFRQFNSTTSRCDPMVGYY